MIRFIHISDTHIGPEKAFTYEGRNTYEPAARLVQFLNNELPFTPDFVLHTGDVTNTPDEANVRLAAQLFNTLKYPIHYVIGNHDNRELLQKLLAQKKPKEGRYYYDFVYKDFHLLVLDVEGKVDPEGWVSDEQLDWVGEICKNSKHQSLAIIMHHLPLHIDVAWIDREMRVMNSEKLLTVLRPHRDRIRGVFFGHIHRAFTGFRDGLLFSAPASTMIQFQHNPDDQKPDFDTMTPGGYAVVTMTHEQTTVTHHVISPA